ncbi:MAG: pilus assembly protein [Myxococcaceae bacterium]|nr:pilus assembly protein [Myxococcaceae bacterium]
MRRHATLRRARGQAMVELALGTIVLVTVLMFAIHFAEIGYISVKVTEAAHSALLEAPGHKLHEWPDDDDPATGAVAQAGTDAQQRYIDFDSTSRTGNTTLTQLFTEASAMSVSCNIGGGPDWDPSPITSLAYSDNGGMRCRAEAQMRGIRLPTEFLEDANQGFFKKKHYEMTPFRVCAFGRANGGACTGELTSVLDDWGLSGTAESMPCLMVPNAPLVPCANAPFWLSAASVHLLTGLAMGWQGTSMALGTVGAMPLPMFPGSENVFWMSAAGEETAFLQPLGNEIGYTLWPTSPALPTGIVSAFYTYAYTQREGCFLGQECPP